MFVSPSKNGVATVSAKPTKGGMISVVIIPLLNGCVVCVKPRRRERGIFSLQFITKTIKNSAKYRIPSHGSESKHIVLSAASKRSFLHR